MKRAPVASATRRARLGYLKELGRHRSPGALLGPGSRGVSDPHHYAEHGNPALLSSVRTRRRAAWCSTTGPSPARSAIRRKWRTRIAYVLENSHRHDARRGWVATPTDEPDAFTSLALADPDPPLVSEPKTWLLRIGWTRARQPA